MTEFVIHSRESLVFRDGRPFGDSGHVDGGSLQWPLPSTVTGMLRSRIGLGRDPHYFNGTDRRQHIEEIKKISPERIVPMWQGKECQDWTYLFPAPADALLVDVPDTPGSYNVYGYSYEHPGPDEGITLPWQNWRIPLAATREKPARDCPALWFADSFFAWLENGKFTGSVCSRELGVNWPGTDQRLHTAIADAGTAKTHQLFFTSGIRLEAGKPRHGLGRSSNHPIGRYGIGVQVGGLQAGDDPVGPCRFGGERKIAEVEALGTSFPACPDWFADDRFLRLVLVSPGNFGSWAPDWLRADPDESQTQWKTVPGSEIKVRLISAFVARWQPVSGWDLEHRRPRGTRKLVPAGSVYVVELEEPDRAADLARLLWGKTIADNPVDSDGYGSVCIGKIAIEI